MILERQLDDMGPTNQTAHSPLTPPSLTTVAGRDSGD